MGVIRGSETTAIDKFILAQNNLNKAVDEYALGQLSTIKIPLFECVRSFKLLVHEGHAEELLSHLFSDKTVFKDVAANQSMLVLAHTLLNEQSGTLFRALVLDRNLIKENKLTTSQWDELNSFFQVSAQKLRGKGPTTIGHMPNPGDLFTKKTSSQSIDAIPVVPVRVPSSGVMAGASSTGKKAALVSGKSNYVPAKTTDDLPGPSKFRL